MASRLFQSAQPELGVGEKERWGWEEKSHTHSYKYLQFKTSNMVVFFIFFHLLSSPFVSNLIYNNINKYAQVLNLWNSELLK